MSASILQPFIMTLNLLTLNVRGLNHPAKRYSLWQEATKAKADIVAIQETHLQQDHTPCCTHNNYPHIFFASAPVKKRGVLIAIKDSVSFTLSRVVADTDGRYFFLLCTINGCPYTIVIYHTIYAPNVRQWKFMRKLCSEIVKLKVGKLIMCGDFNLVANNVVDSPSWGKTISPTLANLLRSEDLHDVWQPTCGRT